jgi:hypothetical protein
MPEAGPEIPKVDEIVGEEVAEHGRYGRLIAVAVVLTTLVAALVAFAQASALRTHDLADARAEIDGAQALDAAAVGRGKAETQINRFNLLVQQVHQADAASLFQQWGTPSQQTHLAALRWGSVSRQTEADTSAIAASQRIPYICSPTIQKNCSSTTASFSPEQDPQFPTRYMQQSQWPAYRLTALRDAANEQADDAESKFVNYAAALTMLAVAVFLFGYSLTPQGQARRILYSRVAGAFVLVAGIWALVQVATPLATPPAAAATAFADGKVAAGDLNDQAAIADFNRALALRPRFVDAYIDRAAVEYDAGIPHLGTGANSLPTTAGGATIPSTAALDRATSDLEQARSDGSTSSTLLANLAGDLTYRGLLTNSNSDLNQSRSYAEQAIAALKGQHNVAILLAQTYFVLAEDDLALRDPAATGAFRDAETQLGNPALVPEYPVAAALTDLSLIEIQRPSLAPQAEALKEQIVAAGEISYTANGQRFETTPNGYQPAKNFASHVVHLGGVTASPDPGHALFAFNQPGGFNPSYDLLSAQWEYQDPLHHEWATLPEISGPVTKGQLLSLGGGFYASNNPSYVSGSSPATCLPQGKYRVQLFVNGRLAGTAPASSSWPALHAVRFSGVDGAMCVPQGWVPFPSLGAGAGGYVAKDNSAGAFIISIPRSADGELAGDRSGQAGVMDAYVHGFASGQSSLFPGIQAQDNAKPTPFFMSSTNGQKRFWTYNKGYIYSGVGLAANGQIYLGIAWAHSNQTANELFLSLSPL